MLEEKILRLESRMEMLESALAKALKNSSNSSKPPSSDIVKPPPESDAKKDKRRKKKKKKGGQPGHPRHERPPFDVSQVDRVWDYFLEACPDCGTTLKGSNEPPRIVQQVELVERPIQISEHRGLAHWCPQCQAVHYAPIDEAVRRAGLVGPRLTALVAYGRRVLEACRQLFGVIHRRDKLSPEDFANLLEDAGNELCGTARLGVPRTREAENLAKRFDKHGDSYIQFITTPGVEPTNNLAEQAIRFVVIDRHITQGTRSQAGQRWCERIWTVLATRAQQGRSAFQFLHETIVAHFAGRPTPRLVPDTS